jgi:Hsp20/alpha crystallin family
MAVVTRRRGLRMLVVVAAGFPLLVAGGAALLTVVIGGTCAGSGVGNAPSALAIRDVPASLMRIYEQVGARFKLPWEVLAGIGQEECGQGRLPDPSCTPRPGATGPGVAARDRRYGTFSRSITLPAGVEAKTITATTHDGIVAVRISLPTEATKETVTITPTPG